MSPLSRRQTLALLTSGAWPFPLNAIGRTADRRIPLSFGTYGLPGYSVEESITLLSAIGFDSIEIAAMAGYHGAPEQLSKARRREIRAHSSQAKLPIGALMGLPSPTEDLLKRRSNLDRVHAMLELAHDLSPERPPLIQGVLGGGVWMEKRALFRDTLGPWVEIAAEAGVQLSIKPHRGHAMSQVEQGVWLIDQLNATGKVTLVYDFSHYVFRGLDIDESIALAAPHLGYVVVKDAVIVDDQVRFQLPGASGEMPHSKILQKLKGLGYSGEVCCEVSSQVWKVEGYDAAAGAETSFANLTRIFQEAGLRE